MHDLALLLLRLRVDARRVPAPPADRAFWAEVFGDVVGAPSSRRPRRAPRDAPPSARRSGSSMPPGWPRPRAPATCTSAAIVSISSRSPSGCSARRSGARSDVLTAVRAFPEQKMLMLTLERIGIRDAATFAFAARQAAKLETGDGNRGFWVHAQLQSALALVLRMTIAGTLDADGGRASWCGRCWPCRSTSAAATRAASPGGWRATWRRACRRPVDLDMESRLILGAGRAEPGRARAARVLGRAGLPGRPRVCRTTPDGGGQREAGRLHRRPRAGSGSDRARSCRGGARATGDRDESGRRGDCPDGARRSTYAKPLEPSDGDVLPPGVPAPKRARRRHREDRRRGRAARAGPATAGARRV